MATDYMQQVSQLIRSTPRRYCCQSPIPACLPLRAPPLHRTSVCFASFEFPFSLLSSSHSGEEGEEHCNRSLDPQIQTWLSPTPWDPGRACELPELQLAHPGVVERRESRPQRGKVWL